MMTIQEQLNAINETFAKLHRDFVLFESEKKSLSTKFSLEYARVRKKWDKEREQISAVKEDVLKYYRIAKDNSSKELVVSGISGQCPDIARLNSMIEQINSYNRNDPVAGQIIDLASRYIVYLDNELSQIGSKEQAEKRDVDLQRVQESSRLTQQKKRVLMDCERYLQGDDVVNLVRLFEAIHRDYEITESYFDAWGQAVKRKRMMLFGFQQFALDVPQMLCGTLKNSLGHYFNEIIKVVSCPCGFTTDSSEELNIEYIDRNETLVKKGIQALILNFLRYFRPGEYKVSVFDYIHYNADILGPLSVLVSGKNSIIEKTATDSKALKQNVAILADYYRKVEEKIGTISLYQYNKQQKPENRIPFRILIINRAEDVYRTFDDPEMSYIVNNAEKFGITVIHMYKSSDGGSKGTDREKKYLQKSKDCIRIISDLAGNFYIENNVEWLAFKWLDAPTVLPPDFVAKVMAATKPKELGSKYFSRYSMKTPAKSTGKRKPISIPFAVDEDDNVISCSFENDLFAAYIMGAAGSGKSTLLHTIISGLLMNYHPDEVELWLMDFKMLEFKRYVDHRPPHVKYILLEKSEDLVFDIIDRLTELLDKRQREFSQNGWSKLTDVPPEENMPAVFVIIDEFAQMSQILKETKGAGYGLDYTIKLENLLAKGRALGLKFIFASQTYTTGISGLTETACKQIQMRFALKNTPDEIKQTLNLSSDQITPELSRTIASMPAYETIFKWADEDNNIHIGRYRNMYTVGSEIETLVDQINSAIKPVRAGSSTNNTTYIDKKPVLIDGSRPKTFKSQISHYKEYEATQDLEDYDISDILIYAGVPCSFSLAKPFTLCNATAENILVAGGERDSKANIILSILNSYSRKDYDIEIWAHERSPIFRRYKNTVFGKYTQRTDLGEICGQITDIKKAVQKRAVSEKLIVCFGYENLASDFDVLGDGATELTEQERTHSQRDTILPDMNEILQRFRECKDPEEKMRIKTEIAEYNQRVAEANKGLAQNGVEDEVYGGIYDARADMEWIIKRASNYGLHFLFCFDRGRDFINLNLDENVFRHKILFPMSKDESISIMGSRKANEVGDGTCIYSNGKDSFALRPHIYRGVPCNGWMIDDNGNIVQRG